MEKLILNKLPVPTFGWLNVNAAERDADKFGELVTPEITELAGTSETPARAEVTGGGAKFLLRGKENSRSTAVVYVSGSEGKNVETEVKAEAGASVRLVQVYENAGAAIGAVNAEVGENAEFELVQLYLGGDDIVSGIDVELVGRGSRFAADIGYLLGGSDRLDINLVARHAGKKSQSEIAVKGVLSGSAEKTFRGTIDFLNGSSGAKGAENEEVLLMDESVRNKTVPLILCAEEDVEGSHGASIGRLDEEHIFYMQSRGIPEEEIYKLMARSRIEQIVAKLGDEQTVSRVRTALPGGVSDE